MSLTIPSAGTNPGRAAQAAQVEPGALGGALAGFGQVAQQVGLRLEQDRRQRAMEQAEIETARGMRTLAAQVREIEDPYEAEAAWGDGLKSLYDTATGTQGRFALSAADRPDYELSFMRMRDAQAAALPRFTAAKLEARRAGIAELGAEMAETWLDARPQGRAAAEQQFFDFVDRQAAGGLLTPEEAELQKDRFLDDLEERRRARTREAEAAEVPAFSSGELPVADVVAQRLDEDPALSRLAAARAYVPMDPAEVERMADLIARADEMEPAARRAFLDAELQTARADRRARLAPPPFHRGGRVDAAALAEAARRLNAAFRAGRIGAEDFARQADLLREHQELLDD